MSTVLDYAQALLYIERFAATHNGLFPHLGHTYGGGERKAGYFCVECDPIANRIQYKRHEVGHLPDCPYLAYRKAMAAAKKAVDSAGTTEKDEAQP